MNNSEKTKKLTVRARRIQFALMFWTNVARFTRFGIHGFVLWRIRRAHKAAVEYNTIATAHNRRVRREQKKDFGEGEMRIFERAIFTQKFEDEPAGKASGYRLKSILRGCGAFDIRGIVGRDCEIVISAIIPPASRSEISAAARQEGWRFAVEGRVKKLW